MTREPRHDGLPRRTKDELDALLDGGASGDPRLDAVASAAREPGLASELRTAPPQLADVRDPDAFPAPTGAGRRVLTRFAAATLVTKAVVGVAGAVVIGAAAVAGATGHFPGQHRHAPAPAPTSASVRPSSDTTGPTRTAGRSASGSATAATSSTTTAPSSSGTTGPSTSSDLAGLCREWLALPPGPGEAKDSPRFTVLVQAAGGSGKVTGFCRLKVSASVSRTTPTGRPSTSRTVPTSPARRSPSATVSVSAGN